jgi:penicillin G amidase
MATFRNFILLGAAAVSACGRAAPPPAPRTPPLPQTAGTLVVAGLSQPVRIVRDRWGIPHITAQTRDDLFFAQGFVQAQDRLFQMDLWRRSVQGRLAEVLGPNFIDRDAMTRRVQYHGDVRAEWASYGPDVKAIAVAFVSGVNAWVFRARQDPPQEFALAGWRPELWTPEDLLNRTDAFLSGGDGAITAFRAQLAAVVGERRADELLPGGSLRGLPPGADLDRAGAVLVDALRRVGTAPFFSGFASPFVRHSTGGSNAWALDGSRTSTGAPLLASDPHRPLVTPSVRYLVHLQAPGWNVIGATSPWLPGIAIGHNDRVAWGMAAHPANTQDLLIEPASASVERVTDPILIKGNPKPFAFEREYTKSGVVIASDRQRGLVFTLNWTGFLPGSAAELAALALDRAKDASEVREALGHWKMPVVDVLYASAAGVGQMVAGASAPPSSGAVVIAANGSVARTSRLKEILNGAAKFSIDDIRRQQHDVTAWNAEQLVPRLAALRSSDARVDAARRQLLTWDRRITADSPAAGLYVSFERMLWRKISEARVPAAVLDDYLGLAGFNLADAMKADNAVLLDALTASVDYPASRPSQITFTHPLAITQAARRLFNVGPVARDGYDATVDSYASKSNVDIGASFREILDVADWDRSLATSAPGQAESPASPHFSDLAKLWAAGEYFPMSFSDRAIQANTETVLTLQPR